jgi:hypothetical protein
MCDCFDINEIKSEDILISSSSWEYEIILNHDKFGLKHLLISIYDEYSGRDDNISFYECFFARTKKEKKILKMLSLYSRIKNYTDLSCKKIKNCNIDKVHTNFIRSSIENLSHEGCDMCILNNFDNWYFIYSDKYGPIGINQEYNTTDEIRKAKDKLSLLVLEEDLNPIQKKCLCKEFFGNKKIKNEEISIFLEEKLRDSDTFTFYNTGGLLRVKDFYGHSYDYTYYYARTPEEIEKLKVIAIDYRLTYYTEIEIEKCNSIIYRFDNPNLNKSEFWFRLKSVKHGPEFYHSVYCGMQFLCGFCETFFELLNSEENNQNYNENTEEIEENILWNNQEVEGEVQ